MSGPKTRFTGELDIEIVDNRGVGCMCFLKHQDVKSECSKISNELLSFFWVFLFFEATAVDGGDFNCVVLINHIIGEKMEESLSSPAVGQRQPQ
jgi:hypothetical protein